MAPRNDIEWWARVREVCDRYGAHTVTSSVYARGDWEDQLCVSMRGVRTLYRIDQSMTVEEIEEKVSSLVLEKIYKM